VEDVQRLVREALHKYEQRNPRLVTVDERLARQKHKPVTLLFTGLVGSGRLVISYAVERKLFERGILVQILYNRTTRLGQSAALDFASQESSTGLRRAAEVSRLFNEMGVITICSFVAPRLDDRSMVKAIVGADKYLEVFLSCPMDVARQRDKAGLYQRADLGHIKDFPGVSLPYETPAHPDLVLDTVKLSVDQSVDRVIELLEKRSII
jgi:adenylyl-sulfate kinase